MIISFKLLFLECIPYKIVIIVCVKSSISLFFQDQEFFSNKVNIICVCLIKLMTCNWLHSNVSFRCGKLLTHTY